MAAEVQPLVSIVCVTYNHEKYIETAIQSFLMQKTDFPFEICIGEDDSSDRTREICQKYADQYPDKVRLFLRSRKDVIYYDGRPTGRYNFLETLKAARGKYIALCEGDDFWIHPDKLQFQFNFLENNPDYTMVSHAIQIENQDGTLVPKVMPPEFHDGSAQLLASHGNYIPTLSAMFRKEVIVDNLDILTGLPCADFPMWLTCLEHGRIRYFPQVMGIYRNHGNGSWSSLSQYQEFKSNAFLYESLCSKFSPEVNQILQGKACEFLAKLMHLAFHEGKQEEAKQFYDRLIKLDPRYLFQLMQFFMTN